jgi:hypothetical protein
MRLERESVGVVVPPAASPVDVEWEVSAVTKRCIGLDVHRDFARVAIWQDGLVRQAGQIAMTAEALKIFADSLAPTRRGRVGGDRRRQRGRARAARPGRAGRGR